MKANLSDIKHSGILHLRIKAGKRFLYSDFVHFRSTGVFVASASDEVSDSSVCKILWMEHTSSHSQSSSSEIHMPATPETPDSSQTEETSVNPSASATIADVSANNIFYSHISQLSKIASSSGVLDSLRNLIHSLRRIAPDHLSIAIDCFWTPNPDAYVARTHGDSQPTNAPLSPSIDLPVQNHTGDGVLHVRPRSFYESDRSALSPPVRYSIPRISACDTSPRVPSSDEMIFSSYITRVRRDSISEGGVVRQTAPFSPAPFSPRYRRALAQRVQQFRRYSLEDGGLLAGTQRGAVTFVKTCDFTSAIEDSQPPARDLSGASDDISNESSSHDRVDLAVDVGFEPVAITSNENEVDTDHSAAAIESEANRKFHDEVSEMSLTEILDVSREEEVIGKGSDNCVRRPRGDICPVCLEEVVPAVRQLKERESGAEEAIHIVETVMLSCGHVIHLACLLPCLLSQSLPSAQRCPLCRGGMSEQLTKVLELYEIDTCADNHGEEEEEDIFSPRWVEPDRRERSDAFVFSDDGEMDSLEIMESSAEPSTPVSTFHGRTIASLSSLSLNATWQPAVQSTESPSETASMAVPDIPTRPSTTLPRADINAEFRVRLPRHSREMTSTRFDRTRGDEEVALPHALQIHHDAAPLSTLDSARNRSGGSSSNDTNVSVPIGALQ